MTADTFTIDAYAPDEDRECDVCGTSPTVVGLCQGKIVYQSRMCGPCTWGEADAHDPSTWN